MPLLVNYNNKSNTTSFYGFKL